MTNKTVVIGIGNIGRQDDGLGWLFIDYLKSEGFKHLSLEYRYQLQIEDAELISQYDTVIFVDATKEKIEGGFSLRVLKPSNKYGFSSHELMPETILYLADKLYKKTPQAYLFCIKGYQWGLEIGLSKKARLNLNKAKEYFANTSMFIINLN